MIGIADQIATDGSSDPSSGVGFAIPIDLVKSELATLQAGEEVQHAYLGVSTSDVTSTTPGATIAEVAADGPAQAGGLRAGDIITKLGTATVKDQNDLVAAIADHQPDDKVSVTVARGSGAIQVEVTLAAQPAQTAAGG